ncbi:MAG: DUF6912 family protein [Flaviflexus sp.]|uniref:DUF6912 family protein n=1 Tax=Flaviflexus sp. TaxID=1969482 RepID=UPI003F8E22D7
MAIGYLTIHLVNTRVNCMTFRFQEWLRLRRELVARQLDGETVYDMLESRRIFSAISLDDLEKAVLEIPSGHAVTPGVRAFFTEEDDEELDLIVQLAAADDHLTSGAYVPFRLVIAFDGAAGSADENEPSRVSVGGQVRWRDVAAIFVDEEASAGTILSARKGDEDAYNDCADLDMLWYHPSERLKLAVELKRRLAT